MSVKRKSPQGPKLADRFVRAPGAPITDEQAPLLAAEFLKIAKANAVDNIMAIDKRLVVAAIEADPSHPLWQFGYDRDIRSAARKHWISHTGVLLRSIRYETVRGGIRRLEPVWIAAIIPPGAKRQQPQRAHVLRADLLDDDPMFVSALGGMIRRAKSIISELESLTSSRPTPEDIAQLVRGMREVMTTYDTSLVDRAAE